MAKRRPALWKGVDEGFDFDSPTNDHRKSVNVPSFLLDRDTTDVSVASISSDEDASHASKKPVVSERPSARSVMRTTWKVVLGGSAFLDAAACVFPAHFVLQSCEKGGSMNAEPGACSLGKLTLLNREFTVTNPQLMALLLWLDQNAVYIGCAFSVLWCVQAFRDARDNRRKALRERDRKRLLNRGESIRMLDNEDDLVKSGYFNGLQPWVVFYWTLTIQLLLVPVGFYVMLYQTLFNSSAEHEIAEQVGSQTGKDQTLQAILNSTYQVMETSIANNGFTKDARLSVVMLIARQVGNTFMDVVGAKMKKWAVQKGFKEGRKLGVRAIIKPRKVWKQVRKLIKWIRWIKYIAPLIATSNKLRDNCCDLAKKYRQEREAILAQKVRKILWKTMTPEDRRIKAARGIQSMYRSYRVRKARWALAIIQCHRDDIAAIKVQTMLRRMLQRARARIKKKRTELKELEARERLAVRGYRRMTMSPFERRRLYELQDEIKTTKSTSIDRRLLLRPNTRFAVAWKFLFVFCVLIEITDLAVSPILAKQKIKGSKKPMTFSSQLESILIPEPSSNLKECSCYERERENFNSWILAQARPSLCPSDPWYCRLPFSSARSMYSTVMHLILKYFMVIVGTICFLDVPVYFYTGELCGETGTLNPKGFFTRWIAPGLLLQLLVNPQMESTSKLVFSGLRSTLEIGPFRVLRWIEALFYPCLVLAVTLVEKRFWVPAVAHANQNTVEPTPSEEEEAPPAVRRRASFIRRTSITNQRSSIIGFQPRRSSLIFQPARRSSVMPLRASALSPFATTRARRATCFAANRSSLSNEKDKML